MIKISRKLEIFPISNSVSQKPRTAAKPEYASKIPITATAMKTANPALPIPPARSVSFTATTPAKNPAIGSQL